MKSEERFEQAVAAVREEIIDPRTAEAAGERVWARLAHEVQATGAADVAAGALAAHAADTADTPDTVRAAGSDSHRILGCEGFRELMPAYLAAALAEPKRVLLEDHTRECLPCRRALAAARDAKSARRDRSVASSTHTAARPQGTYRRWALAAGLAGVALLSGFLFRQAGVGYLGAAPSVTVRSISGELAVVAGGEVRPAIAGERIAGSQLVRTAQGSGAVLELADGSRIELAERSELGLGRRWDGTILELERGSLIVEAAKQRRGHLYVDSGDCRVSVVGTIFSVNHGAKGSRVSVIEGEVHVREGVELAVLLPGQQFASGNRLAGVSVADEISWSRDAGRYRERLAALKSLGHELDLALTPVSARTSTRLLDLVPAGTGIYVALPNLSQSVGGAWQLVQQRVAENPVLGEWWSEHFANPEDEAAISQAIGEFERFGGELGAEIAVAVDLASAHPGSGDVAASAPVLLAEVRDPARFSPLLDEEIARLNALPHAAESDGDDAPRLRRITDPSSEPAGEGQLLVWLAGDLLFASPSATSLAAIQTELAANTNSFVGTPFHQRLAAIYSDGAEWLVGVDLAAIVTQATAQQTPDEEDGDHAPGEVLEQIGLADADFLILDSRNASGETQSRAHVGFRQERRGLASWLAEPAPVGALDFVSPSAHLAVGGVLKEPAAMLDDLLALIAADHSGSDGSGLQHLADFEAEHGLSLREDLAATLGGDFAFAFDGPWLPMPSWKLVLEVNDAGRLQSTLVRMVEEWNRAATAAAAADGQAPPTLTLSQEAIDGRVVYDLRTTTGAELAHFLFVDGYLVVGPSRALLVEAVAQRAAGITLASSAAFLDLLPLDGEANYSAVVYQNLGGAVGALGEFLGRQSGLSGADRERLTALAGEAGASLAVAYGESRGLTLSTRGVRGPMGISFESLLALGGLFGGDDSDDPSAPAPASSETPNGPQA
ncbi:MAG: FecR domain-containing protein [Thermoanaerobaculia bacterium]